MKNRHASALDEFVPKRHALTMNANHPLRVWRVSKSLGVEHLASLLDVDRATVTRYELGQRIPRPSIMARIEAVTLRRVTASDFLSAIDTPPCFVSDAPPGAEEPASDTPPGRRAAPCATDRGINSTSKTC